MNRQTYLRVVSVVFALVTLVHLARLLSGWSLSVGTWDAPMWISIVAVLAAAYLAWQGWTHSK